MWGLSGLRKRNTHVSMRMNVQKDHELSSGSFQGSIQSSLQRLFIALRCLQIVKLFHKKHTSADPILISCHFVRFIPPSMQKVSCCHTARAPSLLFIHTHSLKATISTISTGCFTSTFQKRPLLRLCNIISKRVPHSLTNLGTRRCSCTTIIKSTRILFLNLPINCFI